MPSVPPIHANVNIHKKNLSKTIATNFQSSITYEHTYVHLKHLYYLVYKKKYYYITILHYLYLHLLYVVQ